MLGHRTSLNQFKIIEIIQSTYAPHTKVKLQINKRRKFGEIHKSVDTKQCIILNLPDDQTGHRKGNKNIH